MRCSRQRNRRVIDVIRTCSRKLRLSSLMRPAGAGLAAVRLYYVSHAPIGVRVRCCSYTYGTPARDMAGFADGIDYAHLVV